MRKADYAALAAIIKNQRRAAHNMAASAKIPEYYEGKRDALEFLADCFSRESSVDRAAFLKACGIDP